ncbi:MAG: hypothetical protein E5V36_00590 [Mesorhizobium sp.]|nr:MAG: hypothetical protein E5V36_00590 [Mesorhizobium sp.]
MLAAVSGAKVKFEPDTGWGWVAWDGTLEVDAKSGRQTLAVNGNAVVVVPDIMGLSSDILGKNYNAQGFDSVPGAILTCTISIDNRTLSDNTRLNGHEVCGDKTTGRFVVSCAPSLSGSVPPAPDPSAAMRSGSWYISDAGQQILATL